MRNSLVPVTAVVEELRLDLSRHMGCSDRKAGCGLVRPPLCFCVQFSSLACSSYNGKTTFQGHRSPDLPVMVLHEAGGSTSSSALLPG